MGTTTNNGWPTPVATDLVKDGWEAIKDLGDAIDTTLGVYAPSTSGLTLINTTSFSGVASQSVNDVFSATYDSYRIVLNLTASTSSNMAINARLRVSGTDATTGYKSFLRTPLETNWTGGGVANLTSTTNLVVGFRHTSTGASVSTLDLHYPQIATQTQTAGFYNSTGDSAAGNGGYIGGLLNDTTQYTSISFIPVSGNITGSVSVYGYNK
jgi:hypothetical protein